MTRERWAFVCVALAAVMFVAWAYSVTYVETLPDPDARAVVIE